MSATPSTTRQNDPNNARGRTRRFPIVLIAVAAIALAALAAIVASMMTNETPAADDAVETADVTVDGEALPAWQAGATDPAVGQPAPAVSGFTPNHTAAEIEPGGDPMILAFMAHWCPHCQNELPVVADWIAEGGDEGVEVVAVSTGVDENRPNYPPSAWFEREGFTNPIFVDDAAGSVANAYGLSSYPFFVFIDAEGRVAGRTGGELGAEQLDAAVAQLTASRG